MLKKLTIAAFALVATSAFAGDDWNMDPATASTSQLMDFVSHHAYKTLSAGDAYTIESFVGGLPGNQQHAILVGLARNAMQAKTIKEENQVAANMMAPSGDAMMASDWSKKDVVAMDNSRPMRILASKKQPAVLSYMDTLKILSTGQGAIDQGLIWSTFEVRPFTASQVWTTCNERELDAIARQIQANAGWTEPARLKYTSLATKSW